MRDLILWIIVEHGMQLAGLLFTGLALAAFWLLRVTGMAKAATATFELLGAHAKTVALEVWQTYVEDLKAGRVDGVLTPAEADHARTLAIAKLKARLSWGLLLQLGGGVLLAIFAKATWLRRLESLLGGLTESAVAQLKAEGKAAGLKTSGTNVPGVALPLKAAPDPR